MDREILKGLKISLGLILGLFFFFTIVFAVGFHQASEILPGIFQGDYIFNGSINLTSGSSINFDSSSINSAPISAFTNIVSYSSDGNFTVPEGINTFMIELWGAGGGASTTSGGGGGAYAKKIFINQIPGTIYNVTIGTGGSGVSSGNGGTGGTTSFHNIVNVTGGGGGQSDQSGASGGNAVGGDINFPGGNGIGNNIGIGGHSPNGGGSGVIVYNGPGLIGSFPGGGGSASTSAQISGNGANGYLIVWY